MSDSAEVDNFENPTPSTVAVDDDTSDRVTSTLKPFVAIKASLIKTSKEWSFILATEVVIVTLLIVEPALQTSTGTGQRALLLCSATGAQCCSIV